MRLRTSDASPRFSFSFHFFDGDPGGEGDEVFPPPPPLPTPPPPRLGDDVVTLEEEEEEEEAVVVVEEVVAVVGGLLVAIRFHFFLGAMSFKVSRIKGRLISSSTGEGKYSVTPVGSGEEQN